jgi:hypothetical protein
MTAAESMENINRVSHPSRLPLEILKDFHIHTAPTVLLFLLENAATGGANIRWQGGAEFR